MITITRRIQINIEGDKSVRDESYKKLREWNEACFRAANWVATHAYVQENTKEFFYMHDDVKIKLADREKDEAGIFNTSSQNTTYKLLSSKLKGEIPAAIFNQVNSLVRQKFNADRKDYFIGNKSLSNYRKDMPIPIGSKDMRNITKSKDGNYLFGLFGINFKTWFGRDLSGNEIIFDRAMSGEYKLCDSSIQFKNNKLFLLAVFKIQTDQINLDANKVLTARLNVDIPITFEVGKNTYEIGNKEEFLHRRLQIQQSLRNAQISCTFNKGGKGRKKKMASVERFKESEHNYVETRIHHYTAKLVDWCLKMKCGKIVLEDQASKEDTAKEEPLLLRNWGYYGMKDKLKYKCAKYGIELIVT